MRLPLIAISPIGCLTHDLNGRGFNSQPFRFQVTTLGKLFTRVFLCRQAV